MSRTFNISRNTLDLWLKPEGEVGTYQAITHFQKGCRHKITDWERFREFAQQQGGKTQAQMAKLWGDNVTQQNISDALKKIGLSRKKRHMVIESEMNSSIPTATVRLDNASLPSSQENALSESVGLQPSNKETSWHR